MDAAQWDAVFATNIRGYFLMARAVRPQMIARGGGAVVNVASVTFFTGNALLLAYVASKGAVIGFTRALAREAGPDGIRANAVAPGAFPTAATEIHADQEGLWRDVLEAQSIKRRGEVEDVARAIAFFASDDSSFVSGQTLLVDGGWMFDELVQRRARRRGRGSRPGRPRNPRRRSDPLTGRPRSRANGPPPGSPRPSRRCRSVGASPSPPASPQS